MELRLIIAYGLMALMIAGALVGYLHLTREQRHTRRAYRRSRDRRRRQLEEAAPGPKVDQST